MVKCNCNGFIVYFMLSLETGYCLSCVIDNPVIALKSFRLENGYHVPYDPKNPEIIYNPTKQYVLLGAHELTDFLDKKSKNLENLWKELKKDNSISNKQKIELILKKFKELYIIQDVILKN